MGTWNHIFLEGYCGYTWMKDKESVTIQYENIEDTFDDSKKGIRKTQENKLYKDGDRPEWCIEKYDKGDRIPCFDCLCQPSKNEEITDSKCPFFVFSEVDDEDRKVFEAAHFIKGETCYDEETGDILKGHPDKLIKDMIEKCIPKKRLKELKEEEEKNDA